MPESLIRAHSQRYSRGKTPEFSHDHHQLIAVSKGALVVDCREARWIVPARHAAWIPAKTRCSLAPSGQTHASVLYLKPEVVRNSRTACEVLNVAPLLQAIVDHLVRLESLPADRAGRRLASVLADQIASAAHVELGLPSPQHPRAIRVAELLMADPSDTPSLVALGKGLSVSARTLARQFIGDTGVTLGQWRRQFRLTHALTLVATGKPVKEVALEVGYESPSAFVAAFKRALGTTPAKLFRT
ncbi:MAG: AraC family transcriptional regulator [Vicinamibacterales bacterium]